jgi:DICT domain-containing protein
MYAEKATLHYLDSSIRRQVSHELLSLEYSDPLAQTGHLIRGAKG